MKLEIRNHTNGDQSILCPFCSKWVKVELRQIKATPGYFECKCGKKYSVFKIGG